MEDFADKAATAVLDEMKGQLMVDVRCAQPHIARAIREAVAAEAGAFRTRLDALGLEESFQVLDDKGDEQCSLSGHDPEKRYAVYDAEMQVVCRCEIQEYAELIRDLLNKATGG